MNITQSILHIIKISRPRFWSYTFGPYILWFASLWMTQSRWLSADFWIWLVYFVVWANVWIYGLNDLGDNDTDEHNTKKWNYEHKLISKDRIPLLIALWLTNIPRLVYARTYSSVFFLVFVGFLACSIVYSLRPRAKAYPFADGILQIVYIIPAMIPFALYDLPFPRLGLGVGFAWCVAMHCFSAIPDIDADQKANLTTTAVLFGFKWALRWTLGWYILASVGWFLLHPLVWIGAMLYVIPTILAFRMPIFTLYRRFPYINGILGMLLFWWLLLG